MKILAIGAAPTALGFAYRLNELRAEGCEKAHEVELLILEQESHPGGLAYTVVDEKGFHWDMGVHITFSHGFPYYEKATRWAVEEWTEHQRNVLVDVNYLYENEPGIRLVPYPAQFAVPLFPAEVKRRCLEELRERYAKEKALSTTNGDGCDMTKNSTTTSAAAAVKNFEDWSLLHFGPEIFRIFLKPYNRKIWTVEMTELAANWVGTRVAKLPQEKLEELCATTPEELKNSDFGWGPNATFSFPKRGGTGTVWCQMAAKLPAEWFQYNSKVVEVDYRKKMVKYQHKVSNDPSSAEATGLHSLAYDALLNASPIDLLVESTGICPPLSIRHTKVFIVGVGLELPMPEFCAKMHWLYVADEAVPFYRVTFISNYGDVTPDKGKYWSVVCECARRPEDDSVTEEEIRDKTVEGLLTKSIIPRREQIVDVYSTTLSYGYPVPTVERDAELARAHQALESHSIYSRGRFGGWKYEVSNQDHCFIQGKELADRLVLGGEEHLYKTGITKGAKQD